MRASDDLQVYLKVNSASFEKGMTEAVKRVEAYKDRANKVPEVNKRLSNSFSQAANNTAIFMGPLDGLAGRLSALGTAFGRFSVGAMAAGISIGAGIVYVAAAVRTYTEFEKQQLRTQGVLEATGYIAGFTARELEAMAQSNARATLASTQGMREAQQVLLTFRSIQGDTFRKALSLAQDMSEVFGGLQQSALQLGKALESPTQGVTALSRAGVTFSEQQRDRISQWVAEGNLARAQAEVLAEVEKQLGGVAARVSDGSIAGNMDSIAQSWENLLLASSRAFGLDEAARETTGFFSTLMQTYDRWAKFAADSLDLDNLDAYNQLLEQQDNVSRLLNVHLARRAKMGQNERVNGEELEKITAAIVHLEAEKLRIADELAQRQPHVKDELNKEAEARKSAAAEQKKLAEQQAAEVNANGLKQLINLRQQLGDEQQAIFNAHAKRLESIETLTISREELEKRGFDTISELRETLTDESIGLMADELAALDRKHQQELQNTKDQAERLAQIQANARQQAAQFTDQFNPALSDTDRAEKQALVQLKKLYEQGLLPDTLTYEQARTNILSHFSAERAKLTQQETQRQASAMARLAAYTARLQGPVGQVELSQQNDLAQLQADLDAKLITIGQFKQAELEIERYYEEEKAKIRTTKRNQEIDQTFSTNQQLGQSVKQLAKWETATTAEKYQGIMGLGNQFLGSMATQSKTAFKLQKAVQVAQAIMNTYSMATGAYQALAPIPIVGPALGAAAAAAAIAFGLAQVNAIRRAQPQGQFHQGIDYVPATGDYTLLKGERVLDKRLNADLKQDLASRRSERQQGTNFSLQVNAHDASGFDRLLVERRDLLAALMREAKNELGEVF